MQKSPAFHNARLIAALFSPSSESTCDIAPLCLTRKLEVPKGQVLLRRSKCCEVSAPNIGPYIQKVDRRTTNPCPTIRIGPFHAPYFWCTLDVFKMPPYCNRVVFNKVDGDGRLARIPPGEHAEGEPEMIYTSGIAVSQMSGSTGGITASRNKGGQYFRTRAVPTTSTTVKALAAKARLALYAAAWGALTTIQRASWSGYGVTKPGTNALGMPKILTGINAYIAINTRLNLAGDAAIVSPPIGSDPNALTTASATFDIGAGTTMLTFTPTPLGATNRLWLEAALVDSPGINYVENLKRFIVASAPNLATGYDYQAAVEAVLGPLNAGQKLVLFPMVYSSTTGLLSRPRRVEGTIIST